MSNESLKIHLGDDYEKINDYIQANPIEMHTYEEKQIQQIQATTDSAKANKTTASEQQCSQQQAVQGNEATQTEQMTTR